MRNLLLVFCLLSATLFAQAQPDAKTARAAAEIESKVIGWRHHLHENPELSNREFETARYVEKHLRGLGLEVKTGIAYTGVVGILKGDKPGGVIALRADMDALPVTEIVDLPYASKVKTTYLGKDVGVMHACGHDTHVAMLMGAAELLSKRKAEIEGTVIFIFQPAEEGAPKEEGGGARMMVEEGVLSDYNVETAFGIHINSQTPVGHVNYKPGGAMAASNPFKIVVKGKQAHGSAPWASVDPVVAAAQIIIGLQTIVSRQMDLTKEPVVISVGKIEGGVRNNIIPDEVTLIGTIRTLDRAMKKDVFERIHKTATSIAEASGASAEVEIQDGTLITFNDPEITRRLMPTVVATAGEDNVHLIRPITGAEDFSFYAEKVPSLFIFLGGMDPEMNRADAPGHHTPNFRVDDRGLKLGVEIYTNVALDYLGGKAR
ncbi:amidohydrolase [Neolewinella aurantiaca]|uniref:Amidohydrolase n=1 Tax=Neolewinella aurantiaca TaxID=2602767 RepID=A0A5C7FY87_9BACT|nr:amidohydrolase [Neolewinella aurantiaca]TXF91821.1 amidohydrolase [Neolewinella aurantiaca]